MRFYKFDRKFAKKKICVKRKRTLFRNILAWLEKKLMVNPDFEDKLPYVAHWYLEFDDENEPGREIGLDVNGQVIVKMPDERNYGFWLDTCMKLDDFKRQFQLQPISEHEFNDLWNSVCYDWKEGKFKKNEGTYFL